MNYYFPIHFDAGNRGCEGIAKGTALLLERDKSELKSLCSDVSLDKKMGIGNYVTLQKVPEWNVIRKVCKKLFFLLEKDVNKQKEYIYRYNYKGFLDQASFGDIMLSTGGDMMCYSNNQVLFTTDYAHEKGLKTVLWGCSMGEQNLTEEKGKTLRNFDLIYARESLSYKFFKSLGLRNVVCCPDPAFVLKPLAVNLPAIFNKGDVLGVNLSNFVLGGFDLCTSFGNQIKKLIDFVIKETDLQVLLIPHVTWLGQDDRIIAEYVKEMYKNTGRVDTLKIDNLNYLQIRYIISNCRFFIGSRTHAVISAYSTCVPTIALGYSIKSEGIARDLGLDDQYVIDSKGKDIKLIDAFSHIMSEENVMRKHLEDVVPEYITKLGIIKSKMRELV